MRKHQMIKKISILTISLFYLYLSTSFAQWKKLQAPDGYKIDDVFAFEDIICLRSSNFFSGLFSELLFSSINSGTDWKPLFQAGSPFSSGYVYNMFHEDKIWYVWATNGLYYSQDNGSSWKSFSILTNKAVTYFHRNGNNLFVFTLDQDIFYSPDNGNTWIFNALDKLDYSSSFVAESSRLFAYHKYVGTNGDFLKRSENNGINWISISDRLPVNTHIKNLFLINSNLYLVSQDNWIYRSVDYGDNWTLIFDNKDGLIINSLASLRDRLVIATSNGIIYTDDEAVTWKYFGLKNPYKAAYTLLKSNSKDLFGVTSRYGIFKIDFQSDTVTSCNNGLPYLVGEIQSLISHKNKLYRVIGNTLLVSENNGINWKSSEYTFPSLSLFSFENFLLSNKNNILYISFDEGRKWDVISSNLTISSYTKIYSFGDKIWIDEGARYGLYYSPDLGQTWQRFDPTQGVFDILYLTRADGKLYLFTNNSLFISADEGKSTYYKNYPNENFLSDDIKYNTVKQGNNYLTFALDWRNHFWALSTDLGDSWKNISIPTKKDFQLPIISAGSWLILTLSFYDDNDYQCVIGSNDNGKNWVNISEGIQGGSLLQANVIEQNGFLFARDYYGDIWSRPVSDLDQPAKKKEIVEFNIIPNPSQGLVTIPLNDVYRGTFEILTLEGKIEYSSNNAEDYLNRKIDLSFLNRGLHLVIITTKDKIYSGKLILY